jgi:hypothetical protein
MNAVSVGHNELELLDASWKEMKDGLDEAQKVRMLQGF